jgi:hypothetical protein
LDRLRLSFALAILIVWVAVCAAAVRDTKVIPLATVVTPVMLLPAGWLFTDGYLRARRGQRERIEREGSEQDHGGRREIR